MVINNKPCITDHEVILRLLEDQKEIKKMRDEGYKIASMVSYQSKVTFECHCLPIFNSDRLEDVCNRYADYFPVECKQMIKQIQDDLSSLVGNKGMSKYKTIMSFGKIPIGLQKMLDIWAGGDFFSTDKKVFRINMNKLFSYMSKFKIGG